MLLPDGKLGMIDFGQVHEMGDDSKRLAWCAKILAIAERDEDWLMEIQLKNTTQRTMHNNAANYLKRCVIFYCDRWDSSWVKRTAEKAQIDPDVESDPLMASMTRMVTILRSMCALMGQPSIDLAARWAPLARRTLTSAGRADVYRKRRAV
jgi:hypothetical protein|eukprot:4773198-Prymnesium_polylepis.1